jgi:hypothetical protein
MKVRLLVSRATNDGAQNRGDEIEVSAAEADALMAAGQAELIRAAAPERAAGRGAKPEKAKKRSV